MKSNRIQLLGLAGLIGMSACVDLNEEIVAGVTAGYYETAAGLEDAVDAAYSGLNDHYAQERNMTMLEYGTDIWTKGADGSHKHWNDYTPQLQPSTSYAREQWDLSYRAINTANAVINRAASIESGISEELKAQRVAEARDEDRLRALERGAEVTGVDFCEAGLELCRRKAPRGTYVFGDATHGQDIIADFNASQSDWKVVLEQFPQAAYNDSVTAAALAGNLPDILDVDGPITLDEATLARIAVLDGIGIGFFMEADVREVARGVLAAGTRFCLDPQTVFERGVDGITHGPELRPAVEEPVVE